MTKKLLPKIKAISPEVAEVLETDTRSLLISMSLKIEINGNGYMTTMKSHEYTNFFDALVDIRKHLSKFYTFLNQNLGTHYVVKNDTDSNLRDLGIR